MFAWACTLATAVFWVGGCGRDTGPADTTSRIPATNAPNATPTQAPASARVATPDYLPAERPHDGYVGSGSCRECHAEEHASWHRSFHRTMTQFPK